MDNETSPRDNPASDRNGADPRDRNFWYNLTWAQAVEFFWGAALPMVAPGTILAVYLKHLGAGEFTIAALPTIQMACNSIAQVPATSWTRRLKWKVRASATLFGLGALFWALTGAVAPWLSEPNPGLMIAAVLVLGACASLFMGAATPLWSDVTARLYPERRRGLAMGILSAVLGAAGILGALYARHVLAEIPYPYSFARLLVVAGVAAGLGCQFLWLAREYVPPSQPGGDDRCGYLGLIRERWRSDRRLRRLVLARGLHDAGAPVGIYFAVYAMDKFGLPDSAAGTFTLAVSGASMVGGLVLGLVGDRRGYRRVMGWSMAAIAGATVWSLLAGSASTFLPVFILQGAAQFGLFTATMNLLIESTEDESDCATPMALFSTLMLPVWVCAPLALGAVAQALSIPHALITGLCLQLLGLVALICLVDDPRRPGRRILTWPAPRRRNLPRLLW